MARVSFMFFWVESKLLRTYIYRETDVPYADRGWVGRNSQSRDLGRAVCHNKTWEGGMLPCVPHSQRLDTTDFLLTQISMMPFLCRA